MSLGWVPVVLIAVAAWLLVSSPVIVSDYYGRTMTYECGRIASHPMGNPVGDRMPVVNRDGTDAYYYADECTGVLRARSATAGGLVLVATVGAGCVWHRRRQYSEECDVANV